MATLITTPLNRQQSFTLRAKVAIVQRGTNVSEIARAIGRSRVATSEAINHGLHEPTRRLIAEHLGIAA